MPLMRPSPPLPPPLPLLPLKYDVFLSFRGEDVRGRFVDHLYARLHTLKVNAFMDDKKLSRGKVIEDSILKAIERSRISVIVFSPGFADSDWCLDELVKIVRCITSFGHVAIPIFFHVSPDDVAAQAGVYKKAFAQHAKVFTKQRVDGWRKALTTLSRISGWPFSEKESEAKLVEDISTAIQKKLNKNVQKLPALKQITHTQSPTSGPTKLATSAGAKIASGPTKLATASGVKSTVGTTKLAMSSGVKNTVGHSNFGTMKNGMSEKRS